MVGRLWLSADSEGAIGTFLNLADGAKRTITTESKTLDFTHAEVAARIFQTWGLPKLLAAAMAAHHSYDGAAPVDNKILFFADALAGLTDLGTLVKDLEAEPQSPQLLQPAEGRQLEDNSLERIVQQAQEDFVVTVNSITG